MITQIKNQITQIRTSLKSICVIFFRNLCNQVSDEFFQQKLIKLIASCFYLGYVPIIPGTIGSLVGLGIYLLTGQNLPLFSVITIFLLTTGFLICGKAEVAFGQKDSKKIVIDEAVGMSLTYFAIPLKFWVILLGFFIFRILDLLKIFPAGSLQRRSGSSGVMWDDIFAGIYSNLLLRLLLILL